jgi:KDO2-lipid IV(A) lauroyltransferase
MMKYLPIKNHIGRPGMKVSLSSFFQSPFNVFLFRHSSPKVAQLYLSAIGQLYYLLKRKEKRLIEKNVRDVLAGESESYVKKVIRETFKGIFSHYFEKMFSALLDYRTVYAYIDSHFKIVGSQLLQKALAQGKGCLLVTAHWGAVEFIPWLLIRHGFPTSVILEYATARLARIALEQGKRIQADLISSSYGESILMRTMQALKSNRVLMTQCDEVDAWRKRRHQTIRLFGKELFFDNTIDVLSRRSGAPVVAAFLKRSAGNRYTLILEDVSVEHSPESTARDVLEKWQRYVREYPEQWYQWKKWREMRIA